MVSLLGEKFIFSTPLGQQNFNNFFKVVIFFVILGFTGFASTITHFYRIREGGGSGRFPYRSFEN